jgi:sterol-4alpha-carboxylate 3-dehydrogenase (decarboxylating)
MPSRVWRRNKHYSLRYFDQEPPYSDPKVEYIIGRITFKEEALSALKKTKATVIINTAFPDPKVPVSRQLEEVNITGMQNLLVCAMECGIQVFVYTSTSAIAQKSYDDIIFANETWALPENPVDGAAYPQTKKVGESLVLDANGQNGLLTVAIRLYTLQRRRSSSHKEYN